MWSNAGKKKLYHSTAKVHRCLCVSSLEEGESHAGTAVKRTSGLRILSKQGMSSSPRAISCKMVRKKGVVVKNFVSRTNQETVKFGFNLNVCPAVLPTVKLLSSRVQISNERSSGWGFVEEKIGGARVTREQLEGRW